MHIKNIAIYNEQKRKFAPVIEFLGLVLLSVVLTVSFAVIAFSALFISTQVEGASMLPTLNALGDHKQDRVFVARYGNSQKGDIVVVKEFGKSYDYIIKRLIATEGDTINVVKKYNTETKLNDYFLEINNKTLNESYIYQHNDIGLEKGENNANGMFSVYKNIIELKKNNPQWVDNTTLATEQQSLVVPENSVFVLGDNRANSTDSSMIGFYENSQILGSVKHILRYNQNVLQYFLEYYTPFSWGWLVN